MIQYKRFALDLQHYADQVLTDDDITKAQELRGYVNPGDLVRNDGFFEARADEKGKDMSPDGKRLKKHQSAQALATGIWEYEEADADDWDTGDDRKPGAASAASRLGWGAGAKQAVAADAADMDDFEKARAVRDVAGGNLY